ncbi:MAG: serine hydrolase, partial [Chitinophagaceae bacterium]
NKEVERMMNEADIPGLSLAIISDNKVTFYNVYGYKQLSKKDKVDKETVFEAASLSKSYLVYAAFKLVDEGKLDLDKPMYKYLDPGGQLSNNPLYKMITPRMILSHSSGIENWQRYNNPDSLEIVSEPGKKFVYSGTGYNLLADVIQLIVGKPYEGYIKEMIIDPLKLKNSYTRFTEMDSGSSHKSIPWNYATGHDGFGKEYNKWKNAEPVAASGNNITAEDYAKLLIAIFDGKHLSEKSVRTILEPVVMTGEERSAGYYGTGFEIYYVDGDTIIAHGGDNSGFKGQVFYSIVKKCGFVFFANSDRGKLLTSSISEMSAGLNVRDLYKKHYPDQYPSIAITLFKTYRESGAETMLAELKEMKMNDRLQENSLYSLGWELIDHDRSLARKLFEENLVLYPLSATSYGFLGELFYKNKKYDSAYKNYVVARELNFTWWNNDNKIKECKDKIIDAERRKALSVNMNKKGESEMHAANYNFMEGVELGMGEDFDGKQLVAYLGSGCWMEFKTMVNAPGNYIASFRVSSLRGGNQLQVWQGEKMLASMEVPSTKGWKTWITLTTSVDLSAGNQLLRINAASQGGGFNVNWMKFSPIIKWPAAQF